jgi:hypothetical protein
MTALTLWLDGEPGVVCNFMEGSFRVI